jgi:hypothetical protein
MVARPDSASDAPARAGWRAVLAALFLTWRRWLSRAVAWAEHTAPALVPAAVSAGSAVVLVGRFLLHPRTITAENDRRLLSALGLGALAAGSAAALWLARPFGTPLAQAVIAVIWTLGWAMVRLGILRLAAPRSSAQSVRKAWAAGLLPTLFAVGDLPRLLVLGGSAWLTLGALRGGGVERRDARRAVAWAFGAEVAAGVLRWLASGVLLYLLAGR